MAQPYHPARTARVAVEHTVRAHLAAFARGDFDTWGTDLAPNVFFTAADPDEVFTDRDAAIAEMHQDFDPAFQAGLQLAIDPQGLVIGLSSDSRVAWCATPLRYTVSFADEITPFVLRHTELLTKHADRWSIVVTHYSLALPVPTVLHALTTGRLPPPRPIGDACGPGTRSLVEQFTDQLADLSRVAISQDAWACGPLPEEQATGATAVHALFVIWTRRWGMFRLRGDGMHAQLAPGGEIGWVGANVNVQMQDAQQQIALPLRMLVVYRKAQLVWEVVQAHVSVGIPDAVAEER